MAGLISNEEANQKLNSNSNFLKTVIHGELKRKPKHPRSSYSERVALAAEAITTSAAEVARKYNYSTTAVEDMVSGRTYDKTGTTGVDVKFVQDVRNKVNESRDKVVDLLAQTLGLITEEDINSLEAKDKIDAVHKLAKTVEVMTPNGNLKVPSVLIIAAPEIRDIRDIEDVVVS